MQSPSENYSGIILDAVVASLGTTMANLGIFSLSSCDVPAFSQGMVISDACISVNTWVSRYLGKPIVVLRPDADLSVDSISQAVAALLYVWSSPCDDPI